MLNFLLEIQNQTKDVKWGVWRSKEENQYTSADRKKYDKSWVLINLTVSLAFAKVLISQF